MKLNIKQHKTVKEAHPVKITNKVKNNKHSHIPSWSYMVRVASKIE